MLTKKDLDKIREVIRDELTVKEITLERTDLATGKTELKTIDLYIPDWIAAELPNLAGALRGVQETADHAKNRSCEARDMAQNVGKILCSFESAMTRIARAAEQLESPEAKLIESSS